MKKKVIIFAVISLIFKLGIAQENLSASNSEGRNVKAQYISNRLPLKEAPYLELPLGAIKPESWLMEQLVRMSTGLTGQLDEIYPEVVGSRNG